MGAEGEGKKVIAPLLSTNALKSNITMIPYNRLIHENRFVMDPLDCIAGLPRAVYCMNLYCYDVATYQAALASYVDFYAATGLTTSYMVTEMFPIKVTLQTADAATAYPYRNAMAYL